MTPDRTHPDEAAPADPDEEPPGGGHLAGVLQHAVRARDRVRSAPQTRVIYRLAVAVVGVAITVGGLSLVPLPGPGWVIVFVGLAVLASEFSWAERLLVFGRTRLRAWTHWLGRQRLWVRIVLTISSAAVVCLVLYWLALLEGVPSWVPDWLVPPMFGR